ncbi:hypothetical protein ACQEVY_21535 [Streptomyces sp. CA-288835]|uniref:hypothetical protein n=1 Tax=Streptomyces sp. CA-288835 TaxID=3240069 RepID=UPI003D8EC10C
MDDADGLCCGEAAHSPQAELFGVWRHHVVFIDSPFRGKAVRRHRSKSAAAARRASSVA